MNRDRNLKAGRLIAKKRKAMNLTLGQLSEMLYATPQAVHLWEAGKRYPDVASQEMILKVLGLNPLELFKGREIFDADFKNECTDFMNSSDEKVFVAGMMQDEDENEVYMDLSGFDVVLPDKDGNPSDKWIPFTDYYNVERPKNNPHDTSDTHKTPKTPYDPSLIYLNHGHSILTIPVELLEELGKPLYFSIGRSNGNLLIIVEDEMNENSFDIPPKVYEGQWKGIEVHGGEFGHALCVEMRVRHCLDLLEVEPEIHTKAKVAVIHLDEIKRSTADIKSSEFLLPQWQYDELGMEYVEDEEDVDE